jgi:hypothetical protein
LLATGTRAQELLIERGSSTRFFDGIAIAGITTELDRALLSGFDGEPTDTTAAFENFFLRTPNSAELAFASGVLPLRAAVGIVIRVDFAARSLEETTVLRASECAVARGAYRVTDDEHVFSIEQVPL